MKLLAFFVQLDHHDAIDETLSLSFNYSRFIGSLFSLADFDHSAMTSDRKI